MSNLSLKEELEIAQHYADKYFDGNVSKFLRVAVRFYDHHNKGKDALKTVQSVFYMLISVSIFFIGISAFVDLSIILTGISVLCAIFGVLYVIIEIKKRTTKPEAA